MSDSDDTDVLLLIPPDLFLIPSSDSEDSSDRSSYTKSKSGVVSELIDHMQSLESRILAIESKDNSNDSINFSRQLSLDSIMNCRQTLPRTKFSVSQTSSLQNTPTKYPQCLSLPSTPSTKHQSHNTNETHHTTILHGTCQHKMSNSNMWNEHNKSKLLSVPVYSQTASQNKNLLHVGVGSLQKEPYSMLSPALNNCENNVSAQSYSSLPLLNSSSAIEHFTSDSKPVNTMSLSEVETMLHEIEATDKALAMRNGQYDGIPVQANVINSPNKRNHLMEKDFQDKRKAVEQQKLKFTTNGYNPSHEMIRQTDAEKKKNYSNFALPHDSSFSSLDTEKFMSEFKSWTPSFHHEFSDNKIVLSEQCQYEEIEKFDHVHQKDTGQLTNTVDLQNFVHNSTEFPIETKNKNIHQYLDSSLISKINDDFTRSQTIPTLTQGINDDTLITPSKSCPSIFKVPSSASVASQQGTTAKKSEFSNNVVTNSNSQNSVSTVNNETQNQRPQRLLTLSDFWNNDPTKSNEEQLRIKLEEERFRREHCEQLIQDLQKKLLEQQEKVAVAVRVDNEKNYLISQFQSSWKKMKQKVSELESERGSLQKILQGIKETHQSEIADYQEQSKKNKEELSKALNLATGYKEKSDHLVKEKVDLLRSHADELQGYKSLVQQAESRYEEIKTECQRLLEKNQQSDEALKAVQQDLNKELLKGGEVRAEMTVIHKALDSCETELAILRQEKENLQLKLKEELSRNNILEQAKASLVTAVEEAEKAEKLAKNEVKLLNEQQENLRAELRDVYQKQVEKVVQTKLQEFQTQLDSAEMVFQNEFDTKQRAIVECAARKIKSIIEKHQFEINLLEEKHKEEKRLYEIKVAQALQRCAVLEAQLNNYQKKKNQQIEQLRNMMQNQCQQALLLISEGTGESANTCSKISADKMLELNERNLDLIPNHYNSLYSEPMKLESKGSTGNLPNVQSQEHHNDSLVTLTSHDDTPLTSRKESKSDIKKYIKMIFDMQQSKIDNSKPKLHNGNPPLTNKENPGKQSMQRDIQTSMEDGSSTWQPISEMSIHETSEYLSFPQKFGFRSDEQKHKPPWK